MAVNPSHHPPTGKRPSDMLLIPTSSSSFSKSTSTALTSTFTPPVKRIKRPGVVLPEDEYTEALSHIIKRDYFPDLLELEAIDALVAAAHRDRNTWSNSHAIIESGRAGTVTTPDPSNLKIVKAMNGQMVPINTNLSLSAFQSLYTSEDNESFDTLLDKQNTSNAQKHAWLWLAIADRQPSVAEVAHRERERRRMLDIAPAALKAVDEADERTNSQRQLAYGSTATIPQNSLILRAHHPDIRPVAPDFRLDPPRNNLLFMPDSVEDRYETTMQASERVSLAGPKMVLPKNTRLPEHFTYEQEPQRHVQPPRPSSPTMSDVHRAIRLGADSVGDQFKSTYDSTDPRSQFVHSFQDQARTLGMSGHVFPQSDGVPQSDEGEPSSNPREGSAKKASSSSDTSFRMANPSKREQLHHRMIDRVLKRNRVSSGIGSDSTPTPSISGLTPSSTLFTPLHMTPSRATPTNQSSSSRSSKTGPPLSAAASRLLQGILAKPETRPTEVARAAAASLGRPKATSFYQPHTIRADGTPSVSTFPSNPAHMAKLPKQSQPTNPSEVVASLPPPPPPSKKIDTSIPVKMELRTSPSRSPSPLPEHPTSPSTEALPPSSLPPRPESPNPAGIVNGVRSGPRFENLTPSQLFHASTGYRYAAFRNNHSQGPGGPPVPKPRSSTYFYSQPSPGVSQQSGGSRSSGSGTAGRRRPNGQRSGAARPTATRRKRT